MVSKKNYSNPDVRALERRMASSADILDCHFWRVFWRALFRESSNVYSRGIQKNRRKNYVRIFEFHFFRSYRSDFL